MLDKRLISNFTAVRGLFRTTASFRHLDMPQYRSTEWLSQSLYSWDTWLHHVCSSEHSSLPLVQHFMNALGTSTTYFLVPKLIQYTQSKGHNCRLNVEIVIRILSVPQYFWMEFHSTTENDYDQVYWAHLNESGHLCRGNERKWTLWHVRPEKTQIRRRACTQLDLILRWALYG